jgi:hypothetical protein
MFNGTTTAGAGQEISVSPPETLLKYDAPLFAGIEPSHPDNAALKSQENNPKIDDMVNSMLPPR